MKRPSPFAISVIAIALASFTGVILAQSSPLAIMGSVNSVDIREKPLFRNGDVVIDERTRRPVRESVYFLIKVRLTYTNRSEETIIVPNPEFFRSADRKARFLDVPSPDAKTVLLVDELDLYGNRDRSRNEALESLNGSFPQAHYFSIIRAGESKEFNIDFNVSSGYKLDTLKGALPYGRDLEFAKPLHPYFKFQFSAPLSERAGQSAPVEAQERWRKFGKLLVNSGGGFSFESEVIINKLADIY